jgi:acyl-[acyl-carrier-protein] desaturase
MSDTKPERDTRLAAKVYELYATFFDKAERERRWNPYKDVPWEKVNRDATEELAVVAETFCAVESYLPDYVSKGINLVRKSFGQAWFAANWAYEESKHSIALQEYLVRSGKRTPEQMFDLQFRLKDLEWELPFSTAQQMTLYGVFQEMATFFIYCKQETRAREEGDGALETIFRLNARDEIAHTRFYQDVIKVLLEEDRTSVLADIAYVTKYFAMPGVGLVPDYEQRVSVMREAGVDRSTFLQKVYFPVLKYLNVSRQEVVEASKLIRHAEPPPVAAVKKAAEAASTALLAP